MNICILMGRLTKDPVLRHTQQGTAVTSFTLAIDRPTKSGEQRSADFIDVVCWERTAEFTAKFFTKGQRVAVDGRLQQRQWEDKDGNKRTSYEVVARNAHFADSKRDDSYGGGSYGGGGGSYGSGGGSYAPPARNDYSAPVDTSGGGFAELMEDDGQLPF